MDVELWQDVHGELAVASCPVVFLSYPSQHKKMVALAFVMTFFNYPSSWSSLKDVVYGYKKDC